MQTELETERPDLDITILAVNAEGFDKSIPDLAALGVLPILQDDATAQVWTSWDAVWRDVIVLDGDNRIVSSFNLTGNSLEEAEHYDALKAIFVATAEAE